jgi:hypothetical protein
MRLKIGLERFASDVLSGNDDDRFDLLCDRVLIGCLCDLQGR